MRVGKFYKECGRRAFSGKFWLVEKWSAGLAVLTAIAAAFIPSTLLHLTELEMARWTTLIPVYFFVFVFVIAVISGFIIAPSKMYQEQVELRIAADEKRKPKLRLFLNSSSLEVLKKASTSQSLGGQRMTVETFHVDGVATIYCKNLGEELARNCAVHVLSFTKNGVEVPLAIPIQLAWGMDLKTQTSFEDLAANDTKRISVAIVAHGGQLWLARPIDLLPIEHQRLFGESGTYVITLQVSSETAPPCQAVVEIVAMAADPVVSGLSKAKGSISLLKA